MESINEEILKSYGITATVLDACESTNEHALINGGVVLPERKAAAEVVTDVIFIREKAVFILRLLLT